MNKQETGGFYISRIYVNAIQDGSHAKKKPACFQTGFCAFQAGVTSFFGQLDNAQLRDRFGQFRRP